LPSSFKIVFLPFCDTSEVCLIYNPHLKCWRKSHQLSSCPDFFAKKKKKKKKTFKFFIKSENQMALVMRTHTHISWRALQFLFLINGRIKKPRLGRSFDLRSFENGRLKKRGHVDLSINVLSKIGEVRWGEVRLKKTRLRRSFD
jgi:hypothetical protein